jgi:hypothetical protein
MYLCKNFKWKRGNVKNEKIDERKDDGVKGMRIVRCFKRWNVEKSVGREDVLEKIIVNDVIFFVKVVVKEKKRVNVWNEENFMMMVYVRKNVMIWRVKIKKSIIGKKIKKENMSMEISVWRSEKKIYWKKMVNVWGVVIIRKRM